MILENKKKDYWVLDLFDGEIYSHSFPHFIKYLKDSDLFQVGDTIGLQVDLDFGKILYYKNGKCLGLAFDEGIKAFKKGKLYPLI
jgi:hypothetical protein